MGQLMVSQSMLSSYPFLGSLGAFCENNPVLQARVPTPIPLIFAICPVKGNGSLMGLPKKEREIYTSIVSRVPVTTSCLCATIGEVLKLALASRLFFAPCLAANRVGGILMTIAHAY
jgi:hypothetical protein